MTNTRRQFIRKIATASAVGLLPLPALGAEKSLTLKAAGYL